MQKQIAKDHKLNHEVVGAFNAIEFGNARKRSDREDEENVQIHLESQRENPRGEEGNDENRQ